MCFTDARKKEILSKPNNATDKEELLKLVADEWRALSARDRASWDEVARNDKVRYG
jgi:HMG (high mobility group) box